MNSKQHPIAEVALPCPLRKVFDYQLHTPASSGMRVLVPFGRRQVVGIIMRTKAKSTLTEKQLKTTLALLDDTPLFNQELFDLCLWAADYYQHPIGDVFASALPKRLRENRPAKITSESFYTLSPTGQNITEETLKRAPAQLRLLKQLQQGPKTHAQLTEQGVTAATLKAIRQKNWITEHQRPVLPPVNPHPETPPTLNPEQAQAVQAMTNAIGQFQPFLLDGITGSGKTEVYFQAMQAVLTQGKQVLVLIPEISLTPQTIARFNKRFAYPIVALHSALSDRQRSDAWLLGKIDKAKIIIGTRSAVFTPLNDPGMIIVDEEHDSSFKQQEGFRYHARDLAIMRAHRCQLPIILGSATPSLESWHNATQGKYHRLILSQRAGNARLPDIHVIHTQEQTTECGFAIETINRIKAHLDQNQQVLVFINRRGYAPVLVCQSCQWQAACDRCDSNMVLHHQRHLRCHHCGKQSPKPPACPECQSTSLLAIGQGTQRIEEGLAGLFPSTDILRVDRDNIKNKASLDALLTTIHQGGAKLLVGTQMLAKGHHFPNVTLVVILDIDSGFLSADFRAPERTGQLIMQVAGRAGRADKPGTVILQTQQTKLPLLPPLIKGDYASFAQQLLTERQLCAFPPFAYLALLRAEAKQANKALTFLAEVREITQQHCQSLGPIPAPMQKKAGFFRAQLLLQHPHRKGIQTAVTALLSAIDQLPTAKQVRWSIDIDPIDLFT